ncbi:tellurite resistance TerB family protein [Chitinilyticum aquatile]|uniref:tellurite resistance TerB family protein n=1 Tax=Chitinilyticum aquatile TaxID=362520 RepID=UPI0004261BAE|nr:tellurite resistance TerB family protein [Chitinilyticum aquatile]
MGLLDKAFGLVTKTNDESVQGAFVNLCIAAAGADGCVSNQEGRSIMTYIARLKMFDEINDGKLEKLFDKAFATLESKGPHELVKLGSAGIPKELRPTAFACVADIVLADGELEDEEKEVLERIVTALELDQSTAVSIIEVMLIKNKM